MICHETSRPSIIVLDCSCGENNHSSAGLSSEITFAAKTTYKKTTKVVNDYITFHALRAIGLSAEYSSRHLGLRSANQHQLTVPRGALSANYIRPSGFLSFAVACPTVWNSLPTEFRDLSVGFDVLGALLRRYYSRDIFASSA